MRHHNVERSSGPQETFAGEVPYTSFHGRSEEPRHYDPVEGHERQFLNRYSAEPLLGGSEDSPFSDTPKRLSALVSAAPVPFLPSGVSGGIATGNGGAEYSPSVGSWEFNQLLQRMRLVEFECIQKDQECFALRSQLEELVREKDQITERNKILQQRMWADRQYFAQYSRIFLEAQESGMRRELQKEEQKDWAELMLLNVSSHAAQLAKGSQRESSDTDGSAADATPGRGAPSSYSRPQRRGESWSVSPRHHGTPSPMPYRENSIRISEVGVENKSIERAETPRLALLIQREKDMKKMIEEQRGQMDELERKNDGTAADLACERALTLEMQEEIDDLILSEVTLHEETSRTLVEKSWSEELLGLVMQHFVPKCSTSSSAALLPKGVEGMLASTVRNTVLSTLERSFTPALQTLENTVRTVMTSLESRLGTDALIPESRNIEKCAERVEDSIRKGFLELSAEVSQHTFTAERLVQDALQSISNCSPSIVQSELNIHSIQKSLDRAAEERKEIQKQLRAILDSQNSFQGTCGASRDSAAQARTPKMNSCTGEQGGTSAVLEKHSTFSEAPSPLPVQSTNRRTIEAEIRSPPLLFKASTEERSQSMTRRSLTHEWDATTSASTVASSSSSSAVTPAKMKALQ